MYDSVFQDIKNHVVSLTGLERDALHIYVGIGVFLVTSLVFRTVRYRWLVALLLVVIAAVMGEVLDRRDQLIVDHFWYWQGSVHDVINTCFWPMVLFALLTWTRFFKGDKSQ